MSRDTDTDRDDAHLQHPPPVHILQRIEQLLNLARFAMQHHELRTGGEWVARVRDHKGGLRGRQRKGTGKIRPEHALHTER